MKKKLNVNGLEITVTRKKIKHLYLRVKNENVEISCNESVSDEFIKSFVLKHYDKIIRKLKPKKEKEFYINNAPKIILPLVEKYSKLMNLYPSRVSFRFKTSNFGSCSARNHIIFNYYLLDYPTEAIEYVVVHELSHIKYKHHQKPFWDLVKQYFPDYKKAEKILKG